MLRHRLALFPLALLVVASCAGGGSDNKAKATPPSSTTTSASSSTAAPTTAPTDGPPVVVSPAKRAYITAADAICDTMNQRVAALGAPGDDQALQAKVTDQTAAIVVDTLHKLRALPVPAGQATAVAAIYAKVDRLLTDSAKLSAAIRANDQPTAQNDEAALQTDSAAANAASNTYGLTVCGA